MSDALTQSAIPLAKAESARAESDARYRALVQAFSEAVWSYGPITGFEPGTKWWCALTGQSPEEAANEGWFAALHPDDRAPAADAWHRAVAAGLPYDVEYRVRTAAGDYRSFAVRGVPIGEGDDQGWVGTFTDITARQRAQDELRESSQRLQALSRRLLEVQEQERRHLAAELHDEVGQLLTGLNFQLDLATRGEKTAEALAAAKQIVHDLTARVRDLSHRLRPSVLDDLGLAHALDWLADRFRRQSGLYVNLDHCGLEGPLSSAVETAAFRIVQEALTNVARHAGVATADVVVACDAGAVEIRVTDAGRGFDPRAVDPHATGGLSGMRERAEWLGGALQFDSAQGAGVRVVAHLPLDDRNPPEPVRDGRTP